MKILKLIDGKKIRLTNQEADALILTIENSNRKLVKLSSGDLINITSISWLGEPEQKAYWRGNRLNGEEGNFWFWQDGEKAHLDKKHLPEFIYMQDFEDREESLLLESKNESAAKGGKNVGHH